jgi:hypothetical protein
MTFREDCIGEEQNLLVDYNGIDELKGLLEARKKDIIEDSLVEANIEPTIDNQIIMADNDSIVDNQIIAANNESIVDNVMMAANNESIADNKMIAADNESLVSFSSSSASDIDNSAKHPEEHDEFDELAYNGPVKTKHEMIVLEYYIETSIY